MPEFRQIVLWPFYQKKSKPDIVLYTSLAWCILWPQKNAISYNTGNSSNVRFGAEPKMLHSMSYDERRASKRYFTTCIGNCCCLVDTCIDFRWKCIEHCVYRISMLQRCNWQHWKEPHKMGKNKNEHQNTNYKDALRFQLLLLVRFSHQPHPFHTLITSPFWKIAPLTMTEDENSSVFPYFIIADYRGDESTRC